MVFVEFREAGGLEDENRSLPLSTEDLIVTNLWFVHVLESSQSKAFNESIEFFDNDFKKK